MEEFVSGKRLAYIEERVHTRAALMVVTASVLPPPFPFTAVVAGTAAFQYQRAKLLGCIGPGRFARFAIEGAQAIHYGRWIIKQAESPVLEHLMIVLILLSMAGTARSIYRRSRGSLNGVEAHKPAAARET